ncbi:MAG: hypothetical protein WA364_07650 [Candidatus Nitrosopolaris sp.]
MNQKQKEALAARTYKLLRQFEILHWVVRSGNNYLFNGKGIEFIERNHPELKDKPDGLLQGKRYVRNAAECEPVFSKARKCAVCGNYRKLNCAPKPDTRLLCSDSSL